MDKKEPNPGINLEDQKVRFDYIKANQFRMIHVDGLFGGISPNSNIFMSLWSERWPIPKQTAHKLSKDGSIQGEILEERVSRDAIVREIDVGVVMNINVAIQMREWLNDKIKAAQSISKSTKSKEK